jgi:N-acetylmuramoyl-L-alanine amidase
MMRSKILAMILAVALAVPSVTETVGIEPTITNHETIENYGFSPLDYEYEEITIVENKVEPVADPIPEPIQEPEPEPIPEYPLTDEEIDLIALVTMAEAEGESEYGKRLVIDTILNRADHEYSYWPDTVTEVIYQTDQFEAMWNGRVDRCYVRDDIVELVKEELLKRTNTEVLYFRTERYSSYGTPAFKEGNHYFSNY